MLARLPRALRMVTFDRAVCTGLILSATRMQTVQCPHHVFDSTDELVVEEQMLRLVLGVGGRVEHPARVARHRPKVLLPGVLRGERNHHGDGRKGLDR